MTASTRHTRSVSAGSGEGAVTAGAEDGETSSITWRGTPTSHPSPATNRFVARRWSIWPRSCWLAPSAARTASASWAVGPVAVSVTSVGSSRRDECGPVAGLCWT